MNAIKPHFIKFRSYCNNNANIIKTTGFVGSGIFTIGYGYKKYNDNITSNNIRMSKMEKDIETIMTNHLAHIQENTNDLKNNFHRLNHRVDDLYKINMEMKDDFNKINMEMKDDLNKINMEMKDGLNEIKLLLKK